MEKTFSREISFFFTNSYPNLTQTQIVTLKLNQILTQTLILTFKKANEK